MADYDFKSLHEFLTQTPEQGLRKMLVDPKGFTEVHYNLLMKVARTGPDEFVKCASSEGYPKIKMGPAEQKIKDLFWKECFKTLQSRGLLAPVAKAA